MGAARSNLRSTDWEAQQKDLLKSKVRSIARAKLLREFQMRSKAPASRKTICQSSTNEYRSCGVTSCADNHTSNIISHHWISIGQHIHGLVNLCMLPINNAMFRTSNNRTPLRKPHKTKTAQNTCSCLGCKTYILHSPPFKFLTCIGNPIRIPSISQTKKIYPGCPWPPSFIVVGLWVSPFGIVRVLSSSKRKFTIFDMVACRRPGYIQQRLICQYPIFWDKLSISLVHDGILVECLMT